MCVGTCADIHRKGGEESRRGARSRARALLVYLFFRRVNKNFATGPAAERTVDRGRAKCSWPSGQMRVCVYYYTPPSSHESRSERYTGCIHGHQQITDSASLHRRGGGDPRTFMLHRDSREPLADFPSNLLVFQGHEVSARSGRRGRTTHAGILDIHGLELQTAAVDTHTHTPNTIFKAPDGTG